MTWPTNPAWAAEAPEELIGELSELDRFACDHMDARVTMDAPENTREGTDLPPDRFTLVKRAEHHFFRRSMSGEIPWVSCAYPTEALAQEAGLTLSQFEDTLYGACLIDWDAEGERMTRYAEQFDVVIVDYDLPDMTGGQLAHEIRGVEPAARVILFSRRAHLPAGELAYVDVHIVKGSLVDNIVETIHELLELPNLSAEPRA